MPRYYRNGRSYSGKERVGGGLIYLLFWAWVIGTIGKALHPIADAINGLPHYLLPLLALALTVLLVGMVAQRRKRERAKTPRQRRQRTTRRVPRRVTPATPKQQEES